MSKKIFQNITAVVLAGGKASRYGGINKAFLEIDGVSFYNRTLILLEKIFEEIIIITNEPSIFPDDNYKKYSDIVKDIGPMGGIHAALNYTQNNEAIFVTAVDMPFLSENVIRKIIDNYYELNPDILVPRTEWSIEHLNSVYKTSVFPKMDSFVRATKKYAVFEFYDYVNMKYLYLEDNPEIRKSFTNINSFNDYEHLINKKVEVTIK